MQDKAYREIEGQAERLGIVEPVKGDAVFYLETAYSTLVSNGGWHTVEIVAAACLYAAVRNKNMPVSIAETAAAIGKPRHIVGAAYKELLKTLQLSMPAFVDFSKYIQRHIAKLGPLHSSNKQVRNLSLLSWSCAALAKQHTLQLLLLFIATCKRRLLSPLLDCCLILHSDGCHWVLQAKVMSTFDKLMEWSLRHADVAAGHTSSLAAAVLHLASEAHQVTRQARSNNQPYCTSHRFYV